MPKKTGVVIIAVGAVLILSALLLLLYNRREDAQAGQKAESLLADVEAAVTQSLDPDMPVVTIDGYGYVGYIEIPALELKLPVMSDWDYTRLQIAPCRQFGSSRTDDLVIAAHNYSSHFGRLKELSEGDVVIFTDMAGVVNRYSIAKLETLAPSDVDAVQNSGYELVLYTCTPGGKTRVTAFCTRSEPASTAPAPQQSDNAN